MVGGQCHGMKVKIGAWFGEFFATEGWRKQEAAHWALQHYLGDRQVIAARVVEVVVSQLNVPLAVLTPGSRFVDDLGVVDLDTVELIMGIEEEFGLEISDADAIGMPTIDHLVAFVLANHTR
jgi:acyl carrier protein